MKLYTMSFKREIFVGAKKVAQSEDCMQFKAAGCGAQQNH
jgi:hypothetical protein